MEMRSGLDEDGEFDDDSQLEERDGPENGRDEGALISCTFDIDVLDTSGIDFDEISEQLLALHRESGIEGFGPEEDEDEVHDDHHTDEGQRIEMSHADLSALLPASFARDDKISAFTNVVHSFGCTPPRSSLSINDLTTRFGIELKDAGKPLPFPSKKWEHIRSTLVHPNLAQDLEQFSSARENEVE